MWGIPGSTKDCLPRTILRTRLKPATCWSLRRELNFSQGEGKESKLNRFFLRLVVFAKSRIEVQPTSCPHSMKMKGIRFPELPMITSSGKALHSYPSMSIFKITSSASMLAWLKRSKKECNAQGVKIDIFVGKCSQNLINIACLALFLISDQYNAM